MAETVRLVESQGPLDDAQLLRAMAAEGQEEGRDDWLLARAWRLGRRLGLDTQLARWRGAAMLALLALVAMLLVGALAAAGTVVHSGRTVNAVAAFFSLLGLHGLTLALWLVGLVAPWPSSGGVLGRLWLEGVARVSKGGNGNGGNAKGGNANGGNANAASLLQASIGLLRRERLAPWLFGWISHTVWALSFVAMLAVLWFAFSFQAYRLTWETTILGPDFFVRFVRATGWLPGWLGFPVPDTATLLAPAASTADQRAWAWWLIGCVVAYGLLPRALLALACAAWWRKRVRMLRLDTADPYYRALLARRDALQPRTQVVDAETPWQAPLRPAFAHGPGEGAALVGFELPPESPWPPFDAAPTAIWSRRIAGTSQERADTLTALRQLSPARLLITCHAASSPDRGTARFVREARDSAAACRLLLLGTAISPEDTARWADWLRSADLAQIEIMTTSASAAAWLQETPHV